MIVETEKLAGELMSDLGYDMDQVELRVGKPEFNLEAVVLPEGMRTKKGPGELRYIYYIILCM